MEKPLCADDVRLVETHVHPHDLIGPVGEAALTPGPPPCFEPKSGRLINPIKQEVADAASLS